MYLSRSGLVCSCQNPTTWPSSCTTIPNLSQFLPIDTACGPSPLFPTYEQHLKHSSTSLHTDSDAKARGSLDLECVLHSVRTLLGGRIPNLHVQSTSLCFTRHIICLLRSLCAVFDLVQHHQRTFMSKAAFQCEYL